MKTRITGIGIICALLFVYGPALGQSGDVPELTNITITRTDSGLEAVLGITGAVNYESFTLFNPNRLIIDLLQVQSFSCEPEIDINSFGVTKIRTAKNQPDVTRVGRSYVRQVCGVKVTRLTPGGLPICPRARNLARGFDGWAEVSRGHSSRLRTAVKGRTRGAEPVAMRPMREVDAGTRAEVP